MVGIRDLKALKDTEGWKLILETLETRKNFTLAHLIEGEVIEASTGLSRLPSHIELIKLQEEIKAIQYMMNLPDILIAELEPDVEDNDVKE